MKASKSIGQGSGAGREAVTAVPAGWNVESGAASTAPTVGAAGSASGPLSCRALRSSTRGAHKAAGVSVVDITGCDDSCKCDGAARPLSGGIVGAVSPHSNRLSDSGSSGALCEAAGSRAAPPLTDEPATSTSSSTVPVQPVALGPLKIACNALRARASIGMSSENSNNASMIWTDDERAERVGVFALARCRLFWNQTWI